MLSEKKKLRYTSASSLLLQMATMVCGFILPKFFLENYGSAANGLITSISQFLLFIALAECGVGAVVQSALYKPLALKDVVGLSKIIVSAEQFFRKIAKILVIYTFVLALLLPQFVDADFDFFYTASLVFIIAISSFAQYYFGITYRLLLSSDQFGFIPLLIQLFALILNCIVCVILMKTGFSIHSVKLISSLIFLMQPLMVSCIAHRWYKIDFSLVPEKNAIAQKWNGLAQHISAIILQCSGSVILTLFTSIKTVSVFSIYLLVVSGIKSIVMSLTNGVQAYLGNLFAKGDAKELCYYFEKFEVKMHFLVSTCFTITALLIVPFVSFYTRGINDANYIQPLFGIMLTIAWGVYCIRLPYNIVVLAVGHYKQTQTSAIIEAVINVLVSVCVVIKLGLIGVAIGTLLAMIYRTIYLAWYISKYVLHRSLRHFFAQILVDVLSICLSLWILNCLKLTSIWTLTTFFDWLKLASKTSLVCFGSAAMINLLFLKLYHSEQVRT